MPVPPPRATGPENPYGSGLLWLEVRDHDLREIERERALRRLLLDVSQMCAENTDPDAVLRAVLVRIVMGLDAIDAWVVLGPNRPVHSPRGPGAEDPTLRAVLRDAQANSASDEVVVLDETQTADLPGAAAGLPGLYVPFRLNGPDRGGLLIVADPCPSDADGILKTIAASLGVAVSRTWALQALRRLNRRLEGEVARRTAELQQEKASLEERVRERTADLEQARLAAVEAERKLFDRERVEGVHELAAGLAHEFNNPLGALQGTLEFLRDELDRLEPGAPLPSDLAAELQAAVRDGISDSGRMAEHIASLFGHLPANRRAAVRTDLDAAVREAIELFRLATPGGRDLASNLGAKRTVGIPHAELTRWVFRLLSAVASSDPKRVHVRTASEDARPTLQVHLPRDIDDAPPDLLAGLVRELHGADVRTRVTTQNGTRVIHLALPAGCGERAQTCARGATR